jgi:hypothetical protein
MACVQAPSAALQNWSNPLPKASLDFLDSFTLRLPNTQIKQFRTFLEIYVFYVITKDDNLHGTPEHHADYPRTTDP